MFGINNRLKKLIDSLKASDDHTDYSGDELARLTRRLDFPSVIGDENDLEVQRLSSRLDNGGTHLLIAPDGRFYTIGDMDGAIGLYEIRLENLAETRKILKRGKYPTSEKLPPKMPKPDEKPVAVITK